MKILTYPNPILKQVSEPVTEFDKPPYDGGLAVLCARLFDAMLKSDGAGLSAIQVGIPKRIVVMQVPGGERYVFINPEITQYGDEKFEHSEGCLSVPGYYEERERHKTITLSYQTVRGAKKEQTFSDLEAFCVQHELDHLEGKLFIDDLSPLKKSRVRKKIEKTLRRK